MNIFRQQPKSRRWSADITVLDGQILNEQSSDGQVDEAVEVKIWSHWF